MSNELIVLASTAAVIGFTHTIFGPDHYIPFIVMSKARKWSWRKTAVITFLCGLGHVLSSILLGFIGIFFGIAVFKLETIESFRGDIAAWFLLIFGFVYFIWGLHRAIRLRPHRHIHPHENGQEHSHVHNHSIEHSHVHSKEETNLTPWGLFTIFVFGPCEPLIPLIMYPAAKFDITSVAIVAFVFGTVTITAMFAIISASFYGLSKFHLGKIERCSHALAGLAIFICGYAVKFLGL
jgi:sulfite exporter TauE/SafE